MCYIFNEYEKGASIANLYRDLYTISAQSLKFHISIISLEWYI